MQFQSGGLPPPRGDFQEGPKVDLVSGQFHVEGPDDVAVNIQSQGAAGRSRPDGYVQIAPIKEQRAGNEFHGFLKRAPGRPSQ